MDENESLRLGVGIVQQQQTISVVRSSNDLPDGYLEAVGDRGRIVKWATRKRSWHIPQSEGWARLGTDDLTRGVVERAIRKLMVEEEGVEEFQIGRRPLGRASDR
ncbi:hypothetical protein HAX54_042224 [Datura stramonium]|uniref:Uncharacterized protein n=1 Tax=Datura stramonium TaxID=4076 RepID=A0ABS8VZB0_DATST|nr:hypothetical protein [Datura stramonium]